MADRKIDDTRLREILRANRDADQEQQRTAAQIMDEFELKSLSSVRNAVSRLMQEDGEFYPVPNMFGRRDDEPLKVGSKGVIVSCSRLGLEEGCYVSVSKDGDNVILTPVEVAAEAAA